MVLVREYGAIPVEGVLARTDLGESPLWDPDAGLRWVDIERRRLFTLDLGGHLSKVALSTTVTAVELGPDRELLAVTSTGFGWLDSVTGVVDPIADVVDGVVVTMNDGAIDGAGRCWAGSAVRDESWRGALFRLDRDRACGYVDGIGMSNGIDWSPTGDVLYHVDSAAGTLTAWGYDNERGALASARVLCEVPRDVGMPDGLTVDHDGNVWVAIWGAGHVRCLDADTGGCIAVVRVPTAYPTSCAFGGPLLSTLYITTAAYQHAEGGGVLYAAEVPFTGRPANRFAGVS